MTSEKERVFISMDEKQSGAQTPDTKAPALRPDPSYLPKTGDGTAGPAARRENTAFRPGEKAPPALPDDEVLYELADLFRVFGDSTRIKILYALHDTELCVQEIAETLGISQSAISHQLRVLKDSKLVRFRRDGKTVYYALDDDHVRSLLNIGMEHIEE